MILGGCNGAGKSTSAVTLVPPDIPFLNADELAKVLPDIQGKHVLAGRQWLDQWEQMAASHRDFAIETTLSSRTLAGRIREVQAIGYRVQIIYFWLPNADLAVERVAERVRNGGHDIPEDVIRRRHQRGWQNFLELYRPLADTWSVHNNETPGQPILIALSNSKDDFEIINAPQWAIFEETSHE